MITTSCMNPGYLKNKSTNFLDFVESVDNTRLCGDCSGIRTIRSRHCAICNRCVERFDHHCPFINNCVGVNNHRMFMIFLITLQLSLIMCSSLSLYLLIISNSSITRSKFASHISWLPLNKPLLYSAAILMLCVSTFFLLSVSLLVYVQINNFLNGKSNSEKFANDGILYGGDQSEIEAALLFSGIRRDLQHLRFEINQDDSKNVNARYQD